MKRENRGITLIALVVTVVVLLILASVATSSGLSIIRQSKLNRFSTEMKLMQTEVNALYDSYTSGETVNVNGIEYVGRGNGEKPGIQEIGKKPEDILDESKLSEIFSSGGSGITTRTGYRYYDRATIEGLNIEGVEGEYLVNVEKRSIISSEGLEYEGLTYYTLSQLPNGVYNIDYEDRNTGKPTFEALMEKMEDGKWRITISNIKYDGYVERWEVKYKPQEQDYWQTSEDLSFIVTTKGPYDIKIANGDIESDIVILESGGLSKVWSTKIDGNGEEEFLDVEKTSDGGYIAVGYTTSTDISGLTNKGSADCLIAKFDSNGNEQWKKSVGGSKYDWYNGVIEITNGTYIAVGTILSTDVVDKNGNNIGHGYDWSVNIDRFSGSMVASEGIIGIYDTNGNEVSLKTTGKATDTYTEGDVYQDGISWPLDIGATAGVNIIITGIDKVSDGGYIVMGKKLLGLPSSMVNDSQILGTPIAIKYNKENNEVYYNNRVDSSVSDYILDKDNNMISLKYSYSNEFKAIVKNDKDYNTIWENADDVVKSIGKFDEETFVGISEDNKLIQYSINDGSKLEEYEIPTYENIYTVDGTGEIIFLGSPTNESGITINGGKGAVISKYELE